MSRLKEILATRTYGDHAGVHRQVVAGLTAVRERLRAVRHRVLVLSGKGGVGKSTVAAHLALALARAGRRVGLLDADLNGPSIPAILGLEDARLLEDGGELRPARGPLGLAVASMGFLLQGDAPLRWTGDLATAPIWLGAMESTALRELLSDLAWGELDELIFDLPPGAAADKPPMIQSLVGEIAGAVVVSNPAPVVRAVVRRSVAYVRQAGIAVLGLVENMDRGQGGAMFAADLGIPYLGAIAHDPALEHAAEPLRPFPEMARIAERLRAALEPEAQP